MEQLSQNEVTTLEVAYMVGEITKSQEVIKKIVENHQLESKKEEVDMCEFITELIEDGEMRGELRGKVKGMVMTLKLLNYPNEVIISNLVKNLELTEKQAMEYLG